MKKKNTRDYGKVNYEEGGTVEPKTGWRGLPMKPASEIEDRRGEDRSKPTWGMVGRAAKSAGQMILGDAQRTIGDLVGRDPGVQKMVDTAKAERPDAASDEDVTSFRRKIGLED